MGDDTGPARWSPEAHGTDGPIYDYFSLKQAAWFIGSISIHATRKLGTPSGVLNIGQVP